MTDLQALNWACVPFKALTVHEVYALLQLRSAVFVVEQACVYLDPDGADPDCHHLLGWTTDGRLVASARLVPAGLKFDEASIGRVVTAPEYRGSGLGHSLMAQAIAWVVRLWGPQPLRIGAQAHLQDFYRAHGFVTVGDPYDEDGILHVHMDRPADSSDVTLHSHGIS